MAQPAGQYDAYDAQYAADQPAEGDYQQEEVPEEDPESRDGVKLSWRVWPSTRLEAKKIVVPLGALYTPLHRAETVTRADYEPIRCSNKNCGAVLNPYCNVDYLNKIWMCPLCLQRNHFPAHYSDLSHDNKPWELLESCTTIEYEPPQEPQNPPAFLFVMDTALIAEELTALKNAISDTLGMLPADALVGIITFGKHVSVHEIGFGQCPKTYCFRGDREEGDGGTGAKGTPLSTEKVKQMLGFTTGAASSAEQVYRFLQPVESIEESLKEIVESIEADPWPTAQTFRPKRCTGVAMMVAIGLMEGALQGQSARIMVFSGGAPSVGPGKVVSEKLEHHIRAHRDIAKGNATFFEEACKFYQGLAKSACENGHVVDLFACCLDQVGVAEQRVVVESTGGRIVLSDTFDPNMPVFAESLSKIFEQNKNNQLMMGFNAEIEVVTSRKEIKIGGCVGHVSAMDKKSPSVAEHETGLGGTCLWSLGGVSPNKTVCFFFEVNNSDGGKIEEGKYGYIQFITKYRSADGQTITRVTTCAVEFTDPSNSRGLELIKEGFQQETAAIIISRLACHKADTEFATDLLRWLDQMLIRVCSKFGTYRKGDPNSFQLSPQFVYYPQFLYYLRRSSFIQVFNNSPDETAFIRNILLQETQDNAMTMIQPTLTRVTLENYQNDPPGESVLLDTNARDPECILILDDFLKLVTWYGKNVASWRDDNLRDQPDFDYIGEFLDGVQNEVQTRGMERFPYPMEVPCDEGSGQARFLVARLNPSKKHNPDLVDPNAPPPVFTDGLSLELFMQHLRRLAVAEQ